MKMSETAINCEQCGAPIDFRPGDAVAYCTYCGGTTKLRKISNKEMKFMLEAQFKREHLRKLVVGDILKVPGVTDRNLKNMQIVNAKLVFIPYYVAQVHGNLKWAGLGRQASYSFPFKGAYRNISFHTEPESGEFEDQLTASLFAGSEEYEFLRKYKLSSSGKKYFNLGEITGSEGKALQEAYDELQAREQAVGVMKSKHDRLLNEELEQLTDSQEKYSVDDIELLFVPFWFIDWRYSKSDKMNKAIIDASSGHTIEMDTPRPITFWIFSIFTALLMIFIGAVPYLLQMSAPSPEAYIAAVIGVILGLQTFWLIRPKKFSETAT